MISTSSQVRPLSPDGDAFGPTTELRVWSRVAARASSLPGSCRSVSRGRYLGRFFPSEHMTSRTTHSSLAPTYRHRHPDDEVWHVPKESSRCRSAIRSGRTRSRRVVVPPDVEHSARAITECRVIVADHPVRHSVGGVDIS